MEDLVGPGVYTTSGNEQKYIFVADGTNNMVCILDRQNGTTAGSFGGNGRYAGHLHWIDAIAVDSKGNIYTGEVEDGKTDPEVRTGEPVGGDKWDGQEGRAVPSDGTLAFISPGP